MLEVVGGVFVGIAVVDEELVAGGVDEVVVGAGVEEDVRGVHTEVSQAIGGHVQTASMLQLLHPSPSTLLPSSHASSYAKRPSPQVDVHVS